MVTQYPHDLTATVMAPATRDDAGNYVPGATTILTGKCRVEPNGSGRYIVAADGTQVFFSWMVYMPKNATDIPVGAQVVVTDNGNAKASGTVKQYSKGQLNARVWL